MVRRYDAAPGARVRMTGTVVDDGSETRQPASPPRQRRAPARPRQSCRASASSGHCLPLAGCLGDGTLKPPGVRVRVMGREPVPTRAPVDAMDLGSVRTTWAVGLPNADCPVPGSVEAPSEPARDSTPRTSHGGADDARPKPDRSLPQSRTRTAITAVAVLGVLTGDVGRGRAITGSD